MTGLSEPRTVPSVLSFRGLSRGTPSVCFFLEQRDGVLMRFWRILSPSTFVTVMVTHPCPPCFLLPTHLPPLQERSGYRPLSVLQLWASRKQSSPESLLHRPQKRAGDPYRDRDPKGQHLPHPAPRHPHPHQEECTEGTEGARLLWLPQKQESWGSASCGFHSGHRGAGRFGVGLS